MIVRTNDLPIQRAAAADTPASLVDLVRQLAEDSRRLAGGEIQLAKLEMTDKVHVTSKGATLYGIAFGAGVVALSALTLAVVAALTLAVGKVWIAALITGAVEILVGFLVVRGGTHTFSTLSHAVPQAGKEILGTTRRITGRAD
jgi:hypothetical protein